MGSLLVSRRPPLPLSAPRSVPPPATPGAPVRPLNIDSFQATGQTRPAAPRTPVTDATRIVDASGTWRGSEILPNLTQFSSDRSSHGLSHCTASSVLGAAIANGRPATERFVLRLMQANPNPAVNRELRDIYGRLGSGSATYGDLHRLQGILYDTAERDRSPGSVPSEALTMQRLTMGVRRDQPSDAIPGERLVRAEGTGEVPARTRERIARLQPGESFMLNVDGGGPRHAVTIGRDRDGNVYLYDSGRAQGDTFFFAHQQPALFARYIDGHLGNGPMNIVINGAVQRDW